MTTPDADRLLAAILGHASTRLAAEQGYGQLVWKTSAWRGYTAQRDGMAVLTFVSSHGAQLAYEVPGVDTADLT